MKENELSSVGKFVVTVLIGAGAFAAVFGAGPFAAVRNIANGTVVNPGAFWITLAGFGPFLIGKMSVIAKGHWISFGTSAMSESMGNVYRLGYWLMTVGVLLTFG